MTTDRTFRLRTWLPMLRRDVYRSRGLTMSALTNETDDRDRSRDPDQAPAVGGDLCGQHAIPHNNSSRRPHSGQLVVLRRGSSPQTTTLFIHERGEYTTQIEFGSVFFFIFVRNGDRALVARSVRPLGPNITFQTNLLLAHSLVSLGLFARLCFMAQRKRTRERQPT